MKETDGVEKICKDNDHLVIRLEHHDYGIIIEEKTIFKDGRPTTISTKEYSNKKAFRKALDHSHLSNAIKYALTKHGSYTKHYADATTIISIKKKTKETDGLVPSIQESDR